MESESNFYPCAPGTNNILSLLLDAMTENLHSPKAIVTAGDIIPLFEAILGLTGKLEERVSMLAQQMAIDETAASSSARSKGQNQLDSGVSSDD